MKNTSFKRLWTKTSVKRMLSEFKKHESRFLCHASSEFANLWDNQEHKKQIIERAQKFNPELAAFGIECTCLFYSHSHSEGRSVRIKFLENEIERLTSQENIVEKTRKPSIWKRIKRYFQQKMSIFF